MRSQRIGQGFDPPRLHQRNQGVRRLPSPFFRVIHYKVTSEVTSVVFAGGIRGGVMGGINNKWNTGKKCHDDPEGHRSAGVATEHLKSHFIGVDPREGSPPVQAAWRISIQASTSLRRQPTRRAASATRAGNFPSRSIRQMVV